MRQKERGFERGERKRDTEIKREVEPDRGGEGERGTKKHREGERKRDRQTQSRKSERLRKREEQMIETDIHRVRQGDKKTDRERVITLFRGTNVGCYDIQHNGLICDTQLK